MDQDVLALIKTAYPDISMETLVEHDDIMNTFWTDVTLGRQAMLQSP
jgi:hypothetical protein